MLKIGLKNFLWYFFNPKGKIYWFAAGEDFTFVLSSIYLSLLVQFRIILYICAKCFDENFMKPTCITYSNTNEFRHVGSIRPLKNKLYSDEKDFACRVGKTTICTINMATQWYRFSAYAGRRESLFCQYCAGDSSIRRITYCLCSSWGSETNARRRGFFQNSVGRTAFQWRMGTRPCRYHGFWKWSSGDLRFCFQRLGTQISGLPW